MNQDRVFNAKRRKLLRKYIPLSENIVTLGLFGILIGISLWVFAQRHHYDPKERTLSPEQLLQSSHPEKLYTPPLKPWVEPGMDIKPATADLGIFPETILDQDWQLASRLKQFNPNNLFEKIDGEAEKFIRQGFKSLYYIVLKSKDDGSELSIELFDQGSTTGSIGIFSDHWSDDKEIQQNGPVTFFKTSNGVIGRKGRYFFRIAGDRESEKIRKKSEQVAGAFSQLEEPEESVSEEFQILSRGLEIPSSLITFQSKNVFQFDFLKDFWFGQFNPNDPARAFVHQAGSPEEAKKLFEEILNEQSLDYEKVEETVWGVILQHNYLKNYFVISQQGSFIFGIENLADKNQIQPIMEKFVRGFQHGQ
ncbi:MAG TPA: DUF6599 family protein [Candidatus Limnocylindrales bacterium]|nr:DUF6599 family protein [Candidatus Limnocylindrales bacterium]